MTPWSMTEAQSRFLSPKNRTKGFRFKIQPEIGLGSEHFPELLKLTEGSSFRFSSGVLDVLSGKWFSARISRDLTRGIN